MFCIDGTFLMTTPSGGHFMNPQKLHLVVSEEKYIFTLSRHWKFPWSQNNRYFHEIGPICFKLAEIGKKGKIAENWQNNAVFSVQMKKFDPSLTESHTREQVITPDFIRQDGFNRRIQLFVNMKMPKKHMVYKWYTNIIQRGTSINVLIYIRVLMLCCSILRCYEDRNVYFCW